MKKEKKKIENMKNWDRVQMAYTHRGRSTQKQSVYNICVT